MSSVFIGLMSGTSLDGIDGVIVDFASIAPVARDRAPGDAAATAVDVPAGADAARVPRVLAHLHRGFDAALRAELAALNGAGDNEIHRAALAANALARCYAALVDGLLARAGLSAAAVAAIGCHGQTVRHRPGEFDGTGYTVQLNAPALLAELTGIDVVADFRSRDVAAGGQGAPLVPAFHRAVFARAGVTLAVLNLGGIANLSVLAASGATTGFDCGPANNLLDLWHARSRGTAFDADGSWARQGRVDRRLLEVLLAEPFFALPAPKSTGRDLFNAAWLDDRLARADAASRLRAEDVQATLAELTANVVADACRTHARHAAELVVCGGGTRNGDLMQRLARALAPMPVTSSQDRGLAPEQVEATAFAWLAQAHLARQPGNIAAVTGAAGHACSGRSFRRDRPGPRPRSGSARHEKSRLAAAVSRAARPTRLRRKSSSRNRRWSWHSDS